MTPEQDGPSRTGSATEAGIGYAGRRSDTIFGIIPPLSVGAPEGDAITTARARGRRLAKLINPDGTIEGYDSARLFDLLPMPIDGLGALARLLRQLADRRDCCVLRGAVADPQRTRGVRRLLHPDPVTGEVPTLRDVPRRWLALDVDGLARRDGTAAHALAACAALAIEALPAAFRAADCIIGATASHGVRPGIRLRLWYWLTRPTSGDELRRWLRGAPVDHAVFSAARIIYTAAPLFAVGAVDPVAERMIVLRGARDTVSVPAASALTPPPHPRPVAMTADARGATRYGFAALAAATARVGRAPDGLRHSTLLTEARGLARLVARRLLTERAVTEALAAAAAMAGLPTSEAMAAIAWVLAHSRNLSP